MIILALQLGHNSTVCLMEDGEVTALLSQEKIDNIKNSDAFPAGAIKAVLSTRGLTPGKIDKVVMATKQVFPQQCGESPSENRERNQVEKRVGVAKKLEKSILGKAFPWVFGGLRKLHHQNLQNRGLMALKRELKKLGLEQASLSFVDHHECHARAAFHGLEKNSPVKESLIFTLDGMGDGLCSTVTHVKPDGQWERIGETPLSSSLGMIYSLTTLFLGMKILEHEYKVMGLAAYCKGYQVDPYKRIFDPVIWLNPRNPLEFKSRFNTSQFYEYLCANAVGERFDNLAGGLQMLLEERVVSWITHAIKKTGVRRIFTGGGVFMNVKLNKRIQEMDLVDEVYFLPSCGDESNPIGAAYVSGLTAGEKLKPLGNLYLGLGFSEKEIHAFIKERELSRSYEVNKFDDVEEKIAKLLSEGQIVARFSGPCEWGARSLGNRAILGHPSYMESFYTVNDLIKSRDFWMPFAPTILDSSAGKYLKNYNPEKVEAPYMITAFDATPLAKKELRAAIHQGDHTLRPQVLKKEANPDYYRLIESFEGLTGVGGVLNTSFNLHGYPLVATPEQALMTFEKSGLKNMALGPYLIQKEK